MSAHHQTAAATHRLAAREEAGLAHDKGEAFAREVFGRFLRQATICRDIDDVIEHMHIVNDNAQMFGIRLGGEARIPVAREQVLALASKKKELLALCKSPPRPSRPSAASGGGGSGSGSAGSGSTDARPQSFIFPPPTALATTGHDAPTAVVSRVNEAASTPVDAVAAVTVTGATEMLKAARKLEPALLEQPQPTAAYIPTSSSTSKSARARQNKAPTTVFVRKVDMRMEKDDLRRHFQQFGEVVAISMNPTRGYAFVDFTSHDDVIRAVSATDHQVGHRKLEVEVKKEVGSEQRKLSKSAPMMTGGSRATRPRTPANLDHDGSVRRRRPFGAPRVSLQNINHRGYISRNMFFLHSKSYLSINEHVYQKEQKNTTSTQDGFPIVLGVRDRVGNASVPERDPPPLRRVISKSNIPALGL